MSSSPPNVPYQAYRSKRHSRNASNPYLTPNVSPPPQSRPPTAHSNGHVLSEPVVSQQRDCSVDPEKQVTINGLLNRLGEIPKAASLTDSAPRYESLPLLSANVVTIPVESPSPSDGSPSPAPSVSNKETPPLRPVPVPASPVTPEASLPNGKSVDGSKPVAGSSATSSPGPSPKQTTNRKVTTFRHIPLRNGSTPPRSLAPSPLRPPGTHSRAGSNPFVSSRHLEPSQSRPGVASLSSQVSPAASTPLLQPISNERALPSIPALDISRQPPSVRSPNSPQASSPTSQTPLSRGSSLLTPPVPPPKSVSPVPSQSQNQSQFHTPSPASTLSPASSSSSLPTVRQVTRSLAPYNHLFQPGGVCRPRTDEFIEVRKAGRDNGRIERTRLERRLEKLINLHFPHPDQAKEKVLQNGRPSTQSRRQSSFFDLTFNDLRTKSAGDLWKEVITPQPTPGSKADIRSTEQTITPWEEDASVSQCPLCAASFHPLTNRKHHCRLCGRIICSLPVKYPQRPQTCSLLFVADPITGQIEEVGEGVDYGVRRRTTSTTQAKGKGKESTPSDDDKFLKGVRICRDCQPVLLRRQYIQEVHQTPIFSKLYDAFILLEKEIEDALPQFQELMLSLSNEERPAPEASAARKRLLEAFAQYDALAKRIRNLPCPGGQGGSQDRVQTAILTRANLFLQKNMFPLQAIPKPKRHSNKPSASTTPEPGGHLVDPDSEVAHALQPLLEQEALLESFVEEAKAHRKFEDAKTLKANLAEIRVEIDRILANAETTNTSSDKGKGK